MRFGANFFSNSSWLPQHAGQLRRVSPDEEHHAFILATARDLAAGKSEQEWKAKWLSCIATFVMLDSLVSLRSVGHARQGKPSEHSTIRCTVHRGFVAHVSCVFYIAQKPWPIFAIKEISRFFFQDIYCLEPDGFQK